jgi:hypothetical protein
VPLGVLLLAGVVAACGDDSGGGTASGDQGAGMGALGGSATTETLARTRVAGVPPGDLAWTAYEIRVPPGKTVEHEHELAFVYGRSGVHTLTGAASGLLAEGRAAAIPGGLATATRLPTSKRPSGKSVSPHRGRPRRPASGESSRASRLRGSPRRRGPA